MSTTMTIDTKVNKSVKQPACNLDNIKAAARVENQECDLIHTTPGLTNHCEPLAQ